MPNSLNGSQTDGQATNNEQSSTYQIITDGTVVTTTFANFEAGDKITVKNTTGGAVVKTIIMSEAGASYTENICLPKGCYNFEFTDADFQPTNLITPGVVPVMTVKDDHGFELAKGINKTTASSGAEIGAPKTETVTNKCLPYNPGYIDADFKADQLVVVAGASVTFTDLTALIQPIPTPTPPAPNTWAWDFGDGGTATVKNPVHAFAAPGVYTVKLTANNGIAPSTEIKKNYIRVLPALTGCDEFNNMLAGEPATFSTTVNGVDGFYPGPNVTNVTSYAEKFFAPSASTLSSVEIFTMIAKSPNPAAQLKVAIHGNGGGVPGPAIATASIPLSSVTLNAYNTINFNPVVNVNDIYYVSISVNNDGTDTVVVGSSAFRGADDYSNTAYALIGGTWKPVTTAFTGSSAASLAVKTHLSALPKAKFDSDVTQTCVGKTISYNASLSSNVASYEWTFEDGSPSTSSSATPTVTYNNEGVKRVTLVVKGGCGDTDTLKKTVTVAPPPSVTLEGVDEVCGGSNGYIKAITTGGSNDYVYTWNNGQTSATATGLKAGSYTVTMRDTKCGTVVKSLSISNVNKLPDFDVTVTNTTCGQSNGTAKANPVGGSGTYSYKWTKAGDPSFSQIGRSALGLTPGTYTVEVADGSCAPNQKTVSVGASAGVSGDLTASSTEICQGLSVTLVAKGGTGYIWSDGSGSFAYTDSIVVTPSSTTEYTAKISDASGCFVDIKKVIKVTQSPVPSAEVSNNNVSYAKVAEVNISNGQYAFFSSAGSIGSEFRWYFGDGDSSLAKNPFHLYKNAGTYIVRLYVGISGCLSMDSCQVNVSGTSGPSGISGNLKGVMSIYPNPASGELRILNPENISINELVLFDLVGKEVIRTKAPFSVDFLNISHLPTGSYLLKLDTEKGTLIEKLEIIR